MREAWIDRWKGLLILLVVVGHVVGGGSHLTTDDTARTALEGLYRVIYLFHMPAFFVLAGLCWKTSTDTIGAFLLKKTRRLLVPYFVFGVASIALYLVLQKAFLAQVGTGTAGHYGQMGGEPWWQPFVSLLHAGGWPRGEGFRANSVLWFLPCFFTVEFLYALIDRFFPRPRTQLVLSGLVFLLGYGVRRLVNIGLPWGLGLAGWYLPFLIWGRWAVRPFLDYLWPASEKCPYRFRFAIFVGCALYVLLGWQMPSQYLKVRLDWSFLFALMALIGTALGACVARLSAHWGVAHIGLMSLTIMLVHKFPTLLFQTKVGLTKGLFTGGMSSVFLGVILVTGLDLVLCELVNYLSLRWFPWVIGQRVKRN